MRDYMAIGSAPGDEDCAYVGEPDYHPRARAECARFIALIRKKLGDEPPGARLEVRTFAQDWDECCEVVCYFDDDDKEARNYAYRCESKAPRTWQG